MVLREDRRGVANPFVFTAKFIDQVICADDDDNEDNAERDGKGLSTYYVSRQRGGGGRANADDC